MSGMRPVIQVERSLRSISSTFGVIYVPRATPLLFFTPGVLVAVSLLSPQRSIPSHHTGGFNIALNGGNSAIDVKLSCLVSRSCTVQLNFISMIESLTVS
jgi:hypothetical protein